MFIHADERNVCGKYGDAFKHQNELAQHFVICADGLKKTFIRNLAMLMRMRMRPLTATK